jgi:hypothetical protein
MEIFIGWIAFSVLAGWIASTKHRSGVGFFFLSLFLSPLIGVIAALAVGHNTVNEEQLALERGERECCPHCAELVVRGARTCRFCGRDIDRGAPVIYRTKVAQKGLYLLALPNAKTRTIGSLKSGQPLGVLEQVHAADGEFWLRVRTERGNEGWVLNDVVEHSLRTTNAGTQTVK